MHILTEKDIQMLSHAKLGISHCCQYGHLDCIQYLYQNYHINLHQTFTLSLIHHQFHISSWIFSLGLDKSYIQHLFTECCKYNKPHTAKFLYSLTTLDIHFDNDHLFRLSCENGNLEIATWLYSLQNVNVNANDDHAFIMACKNGHLDVAKWLHSIAQINPRANNDIAYSLACENEKYEILEWISTFDIPFDQEMIAQNINSLLDLHL